MFLIKYIYLIHIHYLSRYKTYVDLKHRDKTFYSLFRKLYVKVQLPSGRSSLRDVHL